MADAKELTLEILKEAVAGTAAAFRRTVRLQPAGGPGTKVFPPTHTGGVYLWETRRFGDDEPVRTVILDSPQSQANRMELALLDAYQDGRIHLPIVQVDFREHFPDIGLLTTLEAPHRIADAVFRESLLGDRPFRDSEVGQAFVSSTSRNATGLLRYCPHALVFGVWDSTGSEGGLGNKFQRAIVSEIVGINAIEGVRTSSRIDPVIPRGVSIFVDAQGEWTPDQEKAAKDEEGKPIKHGKKGTVAELNLGNVTPDFVRYAPKKKVPLRTAHGDIQVDDVLPGGVTISHAIQTVVLSLPALRRLRFPLDDTAEPQRQGAVEARTALAALALAAITLQRDQGYELRSRCSLYADGDAHFERISNDGRIEVFALNSQQAVALLEEAVGVVRRTGLGWETTPITLTPSSRLLDAIMRSRAAGPDEE